MNQNKLQIKQHPLRDQLYAEIHSRPFPLITTTVHATHYALITTQLDAIEQLQLIKKLASENQLELPDENSNCYYIKFPEFDLRWEKHQEFCSLTFLEEINAGTPFKVKPVQEKIDSLLQKIPGELVVALAVHVERDNPQPDPVDLIKYFENHQLYGSTIVGGKASMWSGFRLHTDGFARMLIYDNGMSDYQAGRTLQRIIEVETYRSLALLSLPLARSLMPKIAELRLKLTKLIHKMQSPTDNGLDEHELLEKLSSYAAQIEDHISATTHRFSATDAYAELVGQRLSDLREDSWTGYSSWKKMLQRRLLPAVETCISVSKQLQNLSEQAERASNLLRTRVDMRIASQNQNVLQSLDRRSEQQLRLQQTVEGLSVVAISYYMVSLIKLVAEGLQIMGLNINPGIAATVLSVPVVIVTAIFIRRIHHKIKNHNSD